MNEVGTAFSILSTEDWRSKVKTSLAITSNYKNQLSSDEFNCLRKSNRLKQSISSHYKRMPQ